MSVEQFVTEHWETWQQLETLTQQIGRGRHKLDDREMLAFGQVYRQATADLAVARRDFPDAEVTAGLNALVGQAHLYVYRTERLDIRRITHFYAVGLPQAFRQIGPFVAVAALIFVLTAVVCFIITVGHPEATRLLLPAGAQDIVPIVQQHRLWVDVPQGQNSAVSSLIMTNNIRVAILAFSGGILLGTLTLYILVFNGMMLGAVAGLCQYYGLSSQLWSFVLPHGVIELSVICIGGGAGLTIGWAILRPRFLRRRDAVLRATRQGVQLIFAAIPLLVIAGTIEGFVSPSPLPILVKCAVGLLSGCALYSWLLFSGRSQQQRSRTWPELIGAAATTSI